MEATLHKSVLALVEGDITEQETDAIVNAANERLAGGAGVDGAIHRAGGPAIMAECRQIGGCRTGQAVITTGGDLKARYVIHTVGPVYRGGTRGEAELLKSAYLESLKLASKKGLKSIAFPAISLGIYGYPPAEGARIALKTAIDYLRAHDDIARVHFVLFGRDMFDLFERELRLLL
jgi:O-acetyl-ADP-ribose deacetylase (regulator of RNase III)